MQTEILYTRPHRDYAESMAERARVNTPQGTLVEVIDHGANCTKPEQHSAWLVVRRWTTQEAQPQP
jgi:hypothetical protein